VQREAIYISQGIVVTQLRCAGRCSNHFITNFPQNVPVKIRKIGQYLNQIKSDLLQAEGPSWSLTLP